MPTCTYYMLYPHHATLSLPVSTACYTHSCALISYHCVLHSYHLASPKPVPTILYAMVIPYKLCYCQHWYEWLTASFSWLSQQGKGWTGSQATTVQVVGWYLLHIMHVSIRIPCERYLTHTVPTVACTHFFRPLATERQVKICLYRAYMWIFLEADFCVHSLETNCIFV